MVDPLVALEDAVRQNPTDRDARMIYGDALLERGDPRGELIALVRELAEDGGDASAELARRARAIERKIRADVSAVLPKRAFALCQFAGGIVDAVELVGTTITVDALRAVLRRPELVAVRRVDLRRCWPGSHTRQRELIAALPELLAAGRDGLPPATWLGIGPRGLVAADVVQLCAALPQLRGLGLIVDAALPIVETLRADIVELELASEDMGSQVIAAAARLPLERLVVHAGGHALLRDVLAARGFGALTALGFISEDEDATHALVTTIAAAPVWQQLAAFGIACDDLSDETREWIADHKEQFANVEWFTQPSDLLGNEASWNDARAGLAHLLYEIDREDEVLALCDDLVVDDPSSAWCWDMLGDVLRARDRYEEALEAHTQSCELDRRDCGSWAGRADCLHELTRYDEALHAWGRAIAIDDSEPFAHEGRGRTLWQLGRHDEALAAFAAAVKAGPNYPSARLNRADLLRTLGRFDEAFRAYERSTTASSAELCDVVDGLSGMGLVCQLRGDRKAARTHWRDAAKRAKGTADAERPLRQLALDHVAAGELDKALARLERACAGPAPSEYIRGHRAWLLLDLGRADEALAAFAALGHDGDDVEHVLALDALGRTSEAQALLAAGANEPVRGCVTKWALGHVARAVVGGGKSWVCGGPVEPRALHAALAERARAQGGAIDCHPRTCAQDTATVALLAAALRRDNAELATRARALATDLEVHGPGEPLSRQWAVRWLARRAGAGGRVFEAVLRAVEGFVPPGAIGDQLRR